ncbi:hypothetical protein FisN_6Lh081 [Fistulifera solaris]|uniref:Uncharacterized protein n=1 Tax=Fistulifera solaris TaxID=1519565 RepID=A0A1Z5K523_FISSO|nr:hypothetical protein FisN_6Lh081 [Fistulifera solaris]|eukprot:GAX21353.1 hypothetical protein FisN_6Lh081 [Fistulifera solaris]
MKTTLLVLIDWAQEDLLRPVLILLCAMLLFNLPTLLYKARLFIRAILYFIGCWDKSWSKPQDPGSIFGPHLSQGLPVERRTIYFVRHGESTWNDTFNKGKHRSTVVFILGFIPGLIKALLHELYLLLSGKLDSWFYDAPLSPLGLSQVDELRSFLLDTKNLTGTDAEHLKILRADPGAPRSTILCSNLRRSISTLVGGFSERLTRRPEDKILLVTALQEISRNPDTLSITPPHSPVHASWMEKRSPMCDYSRLLSSQVDVSLHVGDKPINTNGLKRMLDFCDFVFSPSVKDEYIIVGGHSIWFRSFFNMFLPFSVHHVAKNKKIVNGGIVTFDLLKAETKRGPKYMVDPKTIKVIYGGF